jgi:hypothetical protein
VSDGEERVDHPKHYNAHPSGVECIEIAEWLPFNLGNALKYLWRSPHKGTSVEDLKKAAWYLRREQQRLGNRQVIVGRAIEPARLAFGHQQIGGPLLRLLHLLATRAWLTAADLDAVLSAINDYLEADAKVE